MGELSDSIALLAQALRASGQLLVHVEPFTGCVTTKFSFCDTIPLDPKFDVQEKELEEFPGIIVQPDIFWRRLILKWVDKAQWSQKGNTVTIALSQYARRPSSPGELYFLRLAPRRIPSLEIRPLEQEFSLALAPGLKTAFRLDRETRFLLETADGKPPVRDIYRLYVGRFGLVPTWTMVVMLHEIAHGVPSRRLGGRVGEFGLMFYCGLLCAYVDTTSAWAFPRRSDRILVSFAGPLYTIVMGCVFLWGKAAALYAGANDTSALFELLAFLSLTLSLLNLLPVLEFDGYYILVDLLNHPNLKQKTSHYWPTLLKRKTTELPARQQIIYLLYGSGSLAILFWVVGLPLIGAVRALAVGHITIDALLPILMAFLFLAQLLMQGGGRLFHYGRQLEINLKERKSQGFQQ